MKGILIGKIVNIHGIKGEVKAYPYTDDMDNITSKKELYFDKELNNKKKIKSCKIHKNMFVIKFDGIDTVESAESLRNKELYIPKKDISDLEDTYYIEDLIDAQVIDEESLNIIGKITYVFNTGANDVYEVETSDNKNIYLPAIKEVIRKVDITDKKIYVKIMEGLI